MRDEIMAEWHRAARNMDRAFAGVVISSIFTGLCLMAKLALFLCCP